MMNVIKTAIITIIISIISGLLLDYLKNLAPRILCTIGNAVPMELNNRKVYAYSITVSNPSKKIIHELTLNIQSSQSNLKIADAKITKGLKFNSSIKNDILDIDIPFLSKGDKFSVTVYVENQYGECSKPAIVMRSPENFKKIIKYTDKKEVLSDENFTNKETPQNKKLIIVIISIVSLIIVGALVKFCFKDATTNTKLPNAKTDSRKHSTDTTNSSESGTTKNTDIKDQTEEPTGNTNTPAEETTKNTDKKALTGETSDNTDKKASTEGSTDNTDAKTSTEETTKNTDTKASAGETTDNTDKKTSSEGTTDNTDESNKNADTNTSSGETSGNTNEKTPTDGTSGN